MSIRVHVEGDPGEGCFAWVVDLIGCGAVCRRGDDLGARVRRAIAEYRDLVRRHERGLPPGPWEDDERAEVEVAEIIGKGDEILFAADRPPASPAEIERTVELLTWSREELMAVLGAAPDGAFDWDPPYPRGYPEEWAQWRTVREVVGHIAICETRYYLRRIGCDPGPDPGSPPRGTRQWYAEIARDWQVFLAQTRARTIAFLRTLATAEDRARVVESGEGWSVRKVLRRLVWHEVVHTKNIRRILRDFGTAVG